MAQAHRSAPRLSLRDLIAEGTDLSRDAWRDCWLVILLLVGVQTYLFARGHIAPADWSKSPLDWIMPAGLLLYVPLYGSLYRAALGGRPLQGMGLGGMQWKGLEWRLIAVGFVIVFLIGLAAVPFMVMNLIAAVVMGLHSQISMGALGGWARWSPAAVLIWLAFVWLMAPRIARLMLGWAYSSARGKSEPFAGWGPAKASGWSLALALIATYIPLALGWLAVYALILVEPDTLSGEYWPIPESVGVGVLLGLLKTAVVAPLSVGVLTGAWWLLEGDQAAPVPVPKAAAPAPKRDHRSFLDSLGPAAAAALAGAATAVVLHEAAELGLHPHDIDRNAAPPPDHDPDAPPAAADTEPHSTEDAAAEPVAEPVKGEAEPALAPEAPSKEAALETAEPDLAVEPVAAAAPLGVTPATEHSSSPSTPEPLPPAAAPVAEPERAVIASEPPAAAEPTATLAQSPPDPVSANDAPLAAAAVEPVESVSVGHTPAEAPASLTALSAWPHSVLPPWPVAEKVAPVATVAAEPQTLASAAEADHLSGEVSERH